MEIRGSIVALVTPMLADGRVDEAALSRLVHFHCENGTDAIVSVGTTGESSTLDPDEHMEVVRKTIELSGGRIPVIAGTGANSTSEAIDLTRRAKAIGADACLLVTPYYNKPTQEGLFQHYKKVAESVDIPQILYNVPGRTAVDLLPETVERLAGVDRIVGIKEASGDPERVRDIIQRCGESFIIYSGEDSTAMDSMLLGAKGTISVTANVAPKAMHDMCHAAVQGHRAQAGEINETLMALHIGLFVEANPIPAKWALKEMGLIDSGIRLPLTELSAEYHDKVRMALKQANVL